MNRLLQVLVSVALVSGAFAAPPAHAQARGPNPTWYRPQNHVSAAGDLVAALLSGRLNRTGIQPSGNSGSHCKAEPSMTGNFQVTCLKEDDASPQNTQSETSVVAVGDKVVVGFNDSLVCCAALNLSGYSVSIDGGKVFRDQGDLPWRQTVQPIGDPSLATDEAGNIYYATLALAITNTETDSLIALYEMPVGTKQFKLLSVPVNVGDANSHFADKELLAIGRDGQGQRHFYLTWTNYTNSFIQGPVTLSDSTDGVHWQDTSISASSACAPTTPGSHPVPAGGTLYITWEQFAPPACGPNPDDTNGKQFAATVDVATHTVLRITNPARVQGAGDTITFCGFADLEVIETSPGHDSRLFEAPSSTIDPNGTVYEVWNDRPHGPGGSFSNATRIYLSYSTDGAMTWSPPQVISGPLSDTYMADRYQPWVVADTKGLHAMWYERVQDPKGGPDLLRTDKEDLTLATATSAPVPLGEVPLSAVPFPIYVTNPNQDPVIATCYMGDYNQIASNGNKYFVSWGDNRNVVTTSEGVTENQGDVFLQSYEASGG